MEVIKSTCTGSREQLRLPAIVRRGNLERRSGNNECVRHYAEETLVTIHSIRRAYVHMSNLAVHTNRSDRINPGLPFYRTQHFIHLGQPVTYTQGTIRRNRIMSFGNAMQNTLQQLYSYSNKSTNQMHQSLSFIACRLTLRRLMSHIYGAPILDVSRSHTTTQHSR